MVIPASHNRGKVALEHSNAASTQRESYNITWASRTAQRSKSNSPTSRPLFSGYLTHLFTTPAIDVAAVEEEGESHVLIHVRFLVPTHYAPLASVSTTASAPRLWEDALYLRASEVILVFCDPRTLCVLVGHGRDLTLVPAPTSHVLGRGRAPALPTWDTVGAGAGAGTVLDLRALEGGATVRTISETAVADRGYQGISYLHLSSSSAPSNFYELRSLQPPPGQPFLFVIPFFRKNSRPRNVQNTSIYICILQVFIVRS